jgi:hypothetical protein
MQLAHLEYLRAVCDGCMCERCSNLSLMHMLANAIQMGRHCDGFAVIGSEQAWYFSMN